jgi:hypothetical protein
MHKSPVFFRNRGGPVDVFVVVIDEHTRAVRRELEDIKRPFPEFGHLASCNAAAEARLATV